MTCSLLHNPGSKYPARHRIHDTLYIASEGTGGADRGLGVPTFVPQEGPYIARAQKMVLTPQTLYTFEKTIDVNKL